MVLADGSKNLINTDQYRQKNYDRLLPKIDFLLIHQDSTKIGVLSNRIFLLQANYQTTDVTWL